MAKNFVMYDCVRMQVGCPLLQAAAGGLSNEMLYKYFPNNEYWLFSPTADMKLYPVTEEQLQRMSKIEPMPPRRYR